MAASTDSSISSKEDITTCTICFETFQTPKYFPCLHSFCEGCIKTYITTTFEQTKGGIHCPLCRLFLSKPENVSIEEWSVKLPTNHMLVSLMDVNESKSGQKLKLCTACVREKETESACSWCVNCSESLCYACHRAHRRNKFTSSHKLVGIENYESTELPLHHEDIPCTEHPDKKVGAYCTDHSVVCCMTCVMLKHRKCENVGSIEDASEQMKKSREVEEFTKDLNSLQKTLDAMVNDRAENLQKFDKDIKDKRTEIEELFKHTFIHLKRLKSDMLSEISQIEKEVRPEIVDKCDEIKCTISAIQNDLALFQTNMKYAPPAQFLQAMEKLVEQKLILEKFVEDQSNEIKYVEVPFQKNQKCLEIVKYICSIIKINLRKSRKGELPQSTDTFTDITSAVPYLSSMVSVQSYVVGISVLDTGHVVVSDNSGKTLQLRDQHCKTVLSSLSLPGYPQGIKMISDTEGIVAVYGHGLINFNIQNNHITKLKEMRTELNDDFVYHIDKYYVGCGKNIAVYHNSHRKLGDISLNNNVYYMALRDDNSLCYTSEQKVHCVTMGGIPVFTYSHDRLKNPQGITVYQSKHIFVCCFDFKNVHQLRHDGKLHRILLDNLPAYPRCISFSTRGDRAVVGCDNKIAIYDMK
ncbi:hypothetical protein FSP39_021998 [Pinctada imbricata]|uniref:Uncharacterized protein n=1 Tax=Pinctada imbricata TaxID=66713 RepID=A0AA88XNI4_PINIB|nr:hypothetical protein FSP39_021998 [Pinctada imbricata]